MSKNSHKQTLQAFQEWHTWAIKTKLISKPKRKKVAPPIWTETWNG